MKQHTQGLTIIEVLVAIVLLAVLTMVVFSPMLKLFGASKKSGEILDTNLLAQKKLEEARVAVIANYTNPNNFKAKLKELNVKCENMGLYGNKLKDNCQDDQNGGGFANPPIRRLTVSINQNNQTIISSVDVVKK